MRQQQTARGDVDPAVHQPRAHVRLAAKHAPPDRGAEHLPRAGAQDARVPPRRAPAEAAQADPRRLGPARGVSGEVPHRRDGAAAGRDEAGDGRVWDGFMGASRRRGAGAGRGEYASVLDGRGDEAVADVVDEKKKNTLCLVEIQVL